MSKKKCKKCGVKYFFWLIIVFVVLTGVMIAYKSGESAIPIDADKNLAAALTAKDIKTAVTSPTYVYDKLSSRSPVAGKVLVSSTAITPDVILGVFNLSSSKPTSEVIVNKLAINISSPQRGFLAQSRFSNLRLKVGNTVYSAASFSGTGVATFQNLAINLLENNPAGIGLGKDLTLLADINATPSDFTARATLKGKSIVGIDPNWNSLNTSKATDVNSASLTFTASPLSVTNTSTSASPINNGPNPVVAYATRYRFTLNNSGINNIWVSGDPGNFVSTSTTPANNASSTIYDFEPMAPLAGDDGRIAYIIPPGASRTFTLLGAIRKSSNYSTLENLRITGINYGPAVGSPWGYRLTTGLEGLSITILFSSR
ncbi:MAG: hypothetical protein WC385_01575 [Candidatus Paceibacterota bacterium]|jgi:hypothetical protein